MPNADVNACTPERAGLWFRRTAETIRDAAERALPGPIQFATVSTADEVREILELQAENLPSALTPETMATEGFVTVRHDASVLHA